MAGVELRLGIFFFQSGAEGNEFVVGFLPIEQMEAADDGLHRPRAGSEDVLQAAVSTAGEEQPVGIKCQFVTEVIAQVFTRSIADEEHIVSFGQRAKLGDAGDDVKAFINLAGLADEQQPLLRQSGPRGCDTMQKPALREILPLQRIGRDDDAGFRVDVQEMTQAPRMIGMTMRDEHIVHLAEVDAQTVGIADEEVTGSRVEEYAMARGLQQDAQPVFSFETWIAGAIVGQHRPFEAVQSRRETLWSSCLA